jgi:hypothetical protein
VYDVRDAVSLSRRLEPQIRRPFTSAKVTSSCPEGYSI